MLPGARQAESRPLVQRQSIEWVAVQRDRAGIGWKEAGNQIEQRRLAGAVRPDQSEDATLAHRQVDVVGDDDAAETFAQ